MQSLASLLLAALTAQSLALDKLNTDGPLPPITEADLWKISDMKAMMARLHSALDSTCHNISMVDLFFVIDESGSVRSSNWPTVTSFMQDFANEMLLTGPKRSQVGVVLFDYYPHLQWDLQDYSNDPAGLNAKIGALPFTGGGTQIGPAMNMATNRFTAALGARPDAAKVMVVMTDGKDHSNVAAAREAAFLKGIKVVAIGVGPSVSQAQLTQATGDADLVIDVGAGYSGLLGILNELCNVTKDPCADVDCNRRGTCSANSDGSHQCTCDDPASWMGQDCEIAKGDPCASEPCLNGATCTKQDSVNYHCTCPLGFFGNNCQTAACNHHGKFSCKCPPAYEGLFCERVHDFCNETFVIHNGAEEALTICSGHGNCTNDPVNGAHCACEPGWTGKRCDIIVNDCSSSPCTNGGTCHNYDKAPGYYCACPEEYTGHNCSRKRDFCTLQVPDSALGGWTSIDLCGEHGNCTKTADGGAKCTCDPLFTGSRCQTRIPSSCPYTDSTGHSHTYPHRAVWIDDCNECRCEYGVHHCARSWWCPHKCAIYATDATRAANLTVGCPSKQNCIPDDPACGANTFGGAHPGGNPACANPSGWCFPAGHVMVKDLSPFPSYLKTDQPSW